MRRGPNLRHLQHLIATQGDKPAYKQLFMHFFPRIRNFVLQMTGSNETAEELAADALLQVWLRREELPEIDNLSAWLYAIARNAALNVLNKPQRTNLFFLDLTDTVYRLQVRDPEQELIYKESLNRINEAIAALPPRCKMIFRLVREDGLSYKEVAGILNISVNTIDAQMAIAVKRIMKKAGLAKTRSGGITRIIPLRKKS
ncbi:MAG: sigma-70 family RNA polymerase sigma factor [Solitalea sp.]